MNPLMLEWVEKAEGFAVQFRYPGQSADKLDAKSALNAARVVRTLFRARLGLL